MSEIPDEDLWAARQEARRRWSSASSIHATRDRLGRGEGLAYSAAVRSRPPSGCPDDWIRSRIASYKRFHLLGADPERAVGLLAGDRPVQLLLAGKAHPQDDDAKRGPAPVPPQGGARGRRASGVPRGLRPGARRPSWLGCDVWVNLPRSPLEASGTSGMKAALNGVLNLSVLDGWWAEAYDGTNGWAIDGDVDWDHEAQDRRDAQRSTTSSSERSCRCSTTGTRRASPGVGSR